MLTLQSTSDSDQDSESAEVLQLPSNERVSRQQLQVYQEAQQRQAHIVQKLQFKVPTN